MVSCRTYRQGNREEFRKESGGRSTVKTRMVVARKTANVGDAERSWPGIRLRGEVASGAKRRGNGAGKFRGSGPEYWLKATDQKSVAKMATLQFDAKRCKSVVKYWANLKMF